jgi:hypothetical protein
MTEQKLRNIFGQFGEIVSLGSSQALGQGGVRVRARVRIRLYIRVSIGTKIRLKA